MSHPNMPSANEDEFLAKVKQGLGPFTPSEPDGDWIPLLAFEDDSGGLTCAILGTPLQTEAQKDLLAVTVAQLAGKNNPRFIAVVFTSWATFNELGVRPSTSRQRKEYLTISDASRTTEPRVCMAPITRIPNRPPVLGQWITLEGEAYGRWPDAMRAAFAFAAASAEQPELMPAARLGPKEASYRERVLLAKFLGVDLALIRRESQFSFTEMNDLERTA